MRKITALIMNQDEYSNVVESATEDNASLMITGIEWDYVCENGYEFTVEEINEMVGKYLGEKVLDVIIDITNDEDCVVVVVE